MRWEPGEEVVWRETWHGHTYAAMPVRVVEADERQIAVYLAEGTAFHFSAGGAWPFPTGWEDWRPDPSWPVLLLPTGWARAAG